MKSHNTVPLQIDESFLFLQIRGGLFQGSVSGVVSTGLQGLARPFGVYCFRVLGLSHLSRPFGFRSGSLPRQVELSAKGMKASGGGGVQLGFGAVEAA